MADPSGARPPHASRRWTLLFSAAAAALGAGALMVGISDNPPGALLLFASGLSLVLAVAHRWREPRPFAWLLGLSVAAFFVFVVIHNFSEVGADRIAQVPVIPQVLWTVSVFAFIVAVILCPMGAAVGLAGTVITWARRWRRAHV